jgi:hypothetical protein
VTRNGLASTPTEDSPPAIDAATLARLIAAIESLVKNSPTIDPELKCYTPAEAGELLGKTANWVVEAIQDRRVPFTYVGKSPRMTAAHIRWVQANGEVKPSKYAIKSAA